MKYISVCLFIYITACKFKVEVKEKYTEYYDLKTKGLFLKALDALKREETKHADSLFTIVIYNSKNLSKTMPVHLNPYYFRGVTSFDLDKYERALDDFEHAADDTTTNTEILIMRSECLRMIKLYDSSISICNRLLKLKFDSSVVLSQRGLCYYNKGDTINACNDIKLSKLLAPGENAFSSEILKICN
jgi:tetratricopeptide (TPR) repeat protein